MSQIILAIVFSFPILITGNPMSQSGNSAMVMRKAFEGIIAVLGPTGEDAIISELRSKCKYDADYISSEIVRDTLKTFFGPDSAELLLQQVAKVESRLQARIAELKSETH